MQEIRWKEPEIINEIERRRVSVERPKRWREFFLRCLFRLGIFLGLVTIFSLLAWHFFDGKFRWEDHRLLFLIIVMNTIPDFFLVWDGTPHLAEECRLNRFGATRIGSGSNVAWRNIENYRFETDERAPNLSVLVVEETNNKIPLRFYYEGEQLEARLRDAMEQGVDEARKSHHAPSSEHTAKTTAQRHI